MFEVLDNMLISLIIVGYFAYLLPFRFHSKSLLAIPAMIYFTITIFYNYLNYSTTINFFTGFLSFIMVLCFFKNFKAGIFYLLILEIMMLFADSLVFFSFSFLFNVNAVNAIEIPLASPLPRILMHTIAGILLIPCAKKFKSLCGYDVPKTYWFYFSAIPICSVYMMFHCMTQYQKSPETGPETLIALIVLLAINFINLYTYSNAISHYATKLANQSLMEQVNSFAQKQTGLVEAHKSLRTIRHNIKNDLIPVVTAIDEQQYTVADKRLRAIIGEVDTDLFVSHTGIGYIDDMINYKASIAHRSGVNFKVISKLDTVLKLNYLDISSIIGTALDNAIEACSYVTEAKTVDISVMSQAKLFMVKISNPRSNDIRSDGSGGFLSTKPDGAEHGFGLVGIKKLVEKNGGELRIDYPENSFEIAIVLHGE